MRAGMRSTGLSVPIWYPDFQRLIKNGLQALLIVATGKG
jgi:hypothetical protein